MDSRDILIIGAVAVAAYLYFRGNTVSLPAGPAGPGTSVMTSSAAAATSGPTRPAFTSQVGASLGSGFFGFQAINMGTRNFANAVASAVVTDTQSPAPVVRPGVTSQPTFVGGAGVFGAGANTMGPQPTQFNPQTPYPTLRY